MASKVKVGYPSDVPDEEWWFMMPYLLLSRENNAHREHDLRAVFNGVRYIARTGNQWRFMPHNYPPWAAIYQQCSAGCETAMHKVNLLLTDLDPGIETVSFGYRRGRSSTGRRLGLYQSRAVE